MTSQKQKHQNSHHIPVLLETVIKLLSPEREESYLDLTAGYGGHAQAVISRTGAADKSVLVDRDPSAIEALEARFKGEGVKLMQTSFAEAAEELISRGQSFDMVLLDLGISSPQLEEPERGFSFQGDGPLDMRMNPNEGITAAEVVNNYSAQDLEKLIREYGEEPHARTIAKAIVEARPLSTTKQLADTIEQAVHRRGKIHPATRTFQSIRIAVNEELSQLERTLPQLIDLLAPGGRLAIISFHSLEDRLVKRFLQSEARAGYESRLELLTKKPIHGATEDVFNPRARSAKLRAAVRIKTNKGGS